MKKILARITGFIASGALWILAAQSAFAQFATSSASPLDEAVGKGGTGGALADAGSTELTYIIFGAGVLLFVFGTMKVILSLRD